MSLASWWKYGRRTGTSVNGQQDYPEPVHSFLETVLKRLFKYYDIVGKDEGGGNALYLRRFILRWGNGQKGHIFLHHIYRSDSDRYPHSHPWAFKTLVLSGGYTDESYDVHWTLGPPTRDAVDACLDWALMSPDQLIGIEPVRAQPITAEKLAINAVMAGCLWFRRRRRRSRPAWIGP